MKNRFRVLIIGNSVALRVRPPEGLDGRPRNYARLIEEKLTEKLPGNLSPEVVNTGFSRATIQEIYARRDHFTGSMPDVIIYNVGVVDASTREMPLWLANLIKRDTGSWFNSMMHALNHHLFTRFRPLFVYLRGKRPWRSHKKFKSCLQALSAEMEKELGVPQIFLGINKGNDRIEKELPGSTSNYRSYTESIREIAEQSDSEFVDLSDLNSGEHFPDGIHFSKSGHEIVADRICELLENIAKERAS